MHKLRKHNKSTTTIHKIQRTKHMRLSKYFAAAIWQLKNLTLVNNPALINIHSTETFPEFEVLISHGYSLLNYVCHVESIKGIDRSYLIMKFLLKRRHLAPIHSSTLNIPYASSNALVISKLIDFFCNTK